jgi:hypothetical protein
MPETIDIFFYSLITEEDSLSLFKKINIKDLHLLVRVAKHSRVETFLINFIKKNNLEEHFEDKDLKYLEQYTIYRNKKTLAIISDGYILFRKLISMSIEFKPLKGFALNDLVYRDINKRSFRDLDLLIKQDDLEEVCKILISLGYYQYENNKKKYLSDIDTNRYDLRAFINNKNIVIEIHFRVTRPNHYYKCPLLEYFFENNLNMSCKNTRIYHAKKEYHLIHIIYHGTIKQGFDSGLQLFYDVYTILKENDLDYNLIKNLSKESNLTKEVDLVFSLIYRFSEIDNYKYPIEHTPPQKILSYFSDLIILNLLNPKILRNIYPRINSSLIFKGNSTSLSFKNKNQFNGIYRFIKILFGLIILLPSLITTFIIPSNVKTLNKVKLVYKYLDK